MMKTKNIRNAYSVFRKSSDLEKGILSSTKASWCGSGYSLELLPDGNYRVLWDGHIKHHVSTGIIVGIPPLQDKDWDDHYYFLSSAIEELDAKVEQAINDLAGQLP